MARANLDHASLSQIVDIVVGPAAQALRTMDGDFDFVFIDADKTSSADYVLAALRLTRPGAVIVVDNVIRGGAVLDAAGDENVQGVRRLNELLATETRLSATIIQTVGAKGYDGFALALVEGP